MSATRVGVPVRLARKIAIMGFMGKQAKAAPPPHLTPRPISSSAVGDPPSVGRLLSRFNVAFSLMSIIPLLTCLFLITARFLMPITTLLQGLTGVYFLLALVIALLGLLAGHQLIRDIIRRLVQSNLKLSQLNNQQAAFVSNVAHEFRSPLAVFKGALDNLADGLHGPLTEEQVEPVLMCQKEVNRLKRLVGDLLDLSRIEAGKLPMLRQEVVLQETLGAVAQLFSGLLKERGLDLTMDLPETPALMIGDRDRLQQVFVNLFANACKFTEEGGLHVRLTKDADTYQVEIRDTGPGIPAQDLKRIFDKFERVGTQTEEGSGLGLPIARDIVELHHGHIWAESEVGRGSRFIVHLPVMGRSAPAKG